MPTDDENNVVSLPYNGNPNSGYAGSDTSRARAREADLSGVTGDRQRRTITELHRVGSHGLTWKELASITGWHHGTTSGALSNLHKVGRIARLTEVRGRCKVYVLPGDVNGRDTEGVGKTEAGYLMEAMASFIEDLDTRQMSTEQRTNRNRLLNRYRRRE